MTRRLFVSLDFPPERGGIQNYVYGIVSNLNPHESFVLTSDHIGEDNYSEFDKSQDFKIFRTALSGRKSIFKKLTSILILIYKLIYLKFKVGYKEIHFGNVFPIGLVGPLMKNLLNIRYVVYIHGLDVLSLKRKSKFSYILLLFILKNANKIICNSSYTKNIILNMGIKEKKVAIISPGIDVESFKSENKKNLLIDNYKLYGKKVLLTVSRLVERKGHDMVLESLRTLVNEIPDICYVICGDGPDRSRLEHLVKKYSLESSVIFTGSLPNEEVDALYKAADLFIMPSREIKDKGDVEGYGIVFLEANYHKLPVIAGNSGGISDAVLDGETGFLVDPINYYEITDKIKKLLLDQELSVEIGEKGYSWVVDNCLWKHRVEQLQQLKI
ncbi:glycosyltransferase family 4 protein [Bacillus sp. AFS037270]|uniref:glycosyltransferase family 4 protein n=1 Tax=Bacillus sp. AFS037270 TaxID=2033499 RepID=UPI00159B9D7D|nr:glycosyltransferase family 4 protein [Bacillus sp. AFS037270]